MIFIDPVHKQSFIILRILDMSTTLEVVVCCDRQNQASALGLLIDPKVQRGNFKCDFKNPRGEKFSPGLIVPPWAEGESWWQPTTSFSSFKFRWTFPSHKRNCKQNCFPILHNIFIPSLKCPHKMITDAPTQRSYIRLCLRDSLLFANQAQTLVGNPNKEQRSQRWGVLLLSQCKSKG